MKFKARPSLAFPVHILDTLNPFIVLCSITGLVLEYTAYRDLVVQINSIFDMFFLFDFIVRLCAFPAKKYFFKKWGWVDFLASLPAFEAIGSGIPVFMRFFKILRIGRFFKIVRILRFLRIFSFMKKMKDESPYIQQRIMQIGVVIVLVMVFGIALSDIALDKLFCAQASRTITSLAAHTHSISRAVILFGDRKEAGEVMIPAFKIGGVFYNSREEKIERDAYELHKLADGSIEHALNEEVTIILNSVSYQHSKAASMLVLISSLIILMLVIIFYIGFILAKDIRLVNLIIDSIDADDYMLLLEEGKKYKDKTGNFEIDDEEEELTSMFKMVNRLILDKKIAEEFLISDDGDVTNSYMLSEDDMHAIEELDDAELPDTALPDIQENYDSELPDLTMGLSDTQEEDIESFTDTEKGKELIIEDSEELPALPHDEDTVHTPGGDISAVISDANERLKNELADLIRAAQTDTAVQAVRIAAKSILEYIEKKHNSK